MGAKAWRGCPCFGLGRRGQAPARDRCRCRCAACSLLPGRSAQLLVLLWLHRLADQTNNTPGRSQALYPLPLAQAHAATGRDPLHSEESCLWTSSRRPHLPVRPAACHPLPRRVHHPPGPRGGAEGGDAAHGAAGRSLPYHQPGRPLFSFCPGGLHASRVCARGRCIHSIQMGRAAQGGWAG